MYDLHLLEKRTIDFDLRELPIDRAISRTIIRPIDYEIYRENSQRGERSMDYLLCAVMARGNQQTIIQLFNYSSYRHIIWRS